jgi:hypothetical protein
MKSLLQLTVLLVFPLTCLNSNKTYANGSKNKITVASAQPSLKGSQPMNNKAPNEDNPHIVSRQFLVAFNNSDNSETRNSIKSQFEAKELEKVGATELYLFELPENTNMTETLSKISKMPGVRFAEPNLRMKTFQQNE